MPGPLSVFGVILIAVAMVAGGMHTFQMERDMQPKEVLQFSVPKSDGEVAHFSVLKYRSKWYQGTAEVNTHNARLVDKSEITDEVLRSYSQALENRKDPKLCADGQIVAKDQCLKCDGYVVKMVPCQPDPLHTTTQRETYVAVMYR